MNKVYYSGEEPMIGDVIGSAYEDEDTISKVIKINSDGTININFGNMGYMDGNNQDDFVLLNRKPLEYHLYLCEGNITGGEISDVVAATDEKDAGNKFKKQLIGENRSRYLSDIRVEKVNINGFNIKVEREDEGISFK